MITVQTSSLVGGLEVFQSEFNGTISNVEMMEKNGKWRAVISVDDTDEIHIVPLFFIAQTEAGKSLITKNDGGTSDFDDEGLYGMEVSRTKGEKQENGLFQMNLVLNKPAPKAPAKKGGKK